MRIILIDAFDQVDRTPAGAIRAAAIATRSRQTLLTTRTFPDAITGHAPLGRPLVLGVLTAFGLVTALVSEEWGDVWSWVGLGIPVLVMAWYGLRHSSR